MNRINHTGLLRRMALAAAMLFSYAGAQAQVTVGGSIYGGGNLAPVGRGTTVLIDQAGAAVAGDIYGGGALAKVDTLRKGATPPAVTVDDSILVTILQGTLGGNVYGGGLGDSTFYGGSQDVAAHVYGPVHVSIGNKAGGSAVFSTEDNKGMVFGGNNINGSPMDNVRVDIWSTAHGATFVTNLAPTGDDIKSLADDPDELTAADVSANTDGQTYAIQAVYGGGNKGSYLPVADKGATVYVHNCDNTIKDVYGGGNAADVGTATVNAYTHTIVDGGRIYCIFGGGNGFSLTDNRTNPTADNYNPGANIHGTATTEVHGGLINMLFGGSNQMGDIDNIDLLIDHSNSACAEAVVSLFGGANEAPIAGNGTLTIGCGAGSFSEVYGGSNLADIGTQAQFEAGHPSNVTLNLKGGTISQAFGGSKGKDGTAADIYGNVELNIYGGTIVEAFGGSNINGNIAGTITVNVEENSDCPLDITDVYGAGNLTPYSPANSDIAYPKVNIKHLESGNSVQGSVYGGGLGATAIVTANPVVTIGDNNASHLAVVSDNVYGGGNAAAVEGNTTVLMQNANSAASRLFGGGNEAGVNGTAAVTINEGTVSTGVYGGCNAQGTVSGNIAVAVNGGTVGVDGTTTDVVFGGGYGQATKTGANVEVAIGKADASTTPAIYGNVYGGSALGSINSATDVLNDASHTYVTLNKGTVNGDLYGGGLGSSSVEAKEWSPVTVSVKGGTANNVFGSNNLGGAPQSSVNVTMTSGTVNQHVFGGGNEAVYGQGSPAVSVSGGTVDGSVFGGGNKAGVGKSDGSSTTTVSISGGTVASGVYGGCNVQGTVQGAISVSATGGTIGTDDTRYADGLFGGGYGQNTSTTGNVAVSVDGATLYGDVYGGSALGSVNTNNSNTTTVTLTSGTVNGNVYGGGLGDNSTAAMVNGKVTVDINGGTATGVFGCNNINGAPQSTVAVNTTDGTVARLFGGGNQAPYTGTPDVNIGGGTIGNVYGGGNEAGIDGNTDVAMTDGQVTGGIYGGCNTEGTVTGNSTVLVTGGQVGTELAAANGIFGGGYGKDTKVDGDVVVTLGDATGSATPIVYGDLYGGSALGAVNTKSSNISGGINTVNTTTVNILSGHLAGNAYGGGLGHAADPAVAGDQNIDAMVYGMTTVNVGRKNGDTYEGFATFDHAAIYGSNNVLGSPQHNVYVNIYGTAHDEKNAASYGNSGENDATYAIYQVFGGGNEATYAPEGGAAASDKVTYVHIYGCDNTVQEVFGGSNAADAQAVNLQVDGGRFDYVFGGGNGIAKAAEVYKSTVSSVDGGHVGYYFGGSNRLGNCANINAHTGTGSCGEAVIDMLFNGGNMADVYAEELTLDLTCSNLKTYKSVYGGCRLGTVYGNIVINISGGTFSNIYGGCRGALGKDPFAANVRRFPTKTEIEANPDAYVDTIITWLKSHPSMYGKGGNITINITGGDIGRIYGGCDLNGNVEGTITINIDESSTECPLDLDYIYGGGDIAQCRPEDSTIASPIINLINGHVNYDVFGGGRGQATDDPTEHIVAIEAGLVTSNPQVTMSPMAGKNFWVGGNIYGGGEMASVGKYTRNSDGMPTACDAGTGKTVIAISGGSVGPDALAMPMESGMVFGGGKGPVGDPTVNTNIPRLNFVANTDVTISGTALVKGSVYGGSQNGHVLNDTYVKIKGGQIGLGAGQPSAYTDDQFVDPTVNTVTDANANALAECPHWDYTAPYAPYDPYARWVKTGEDTYADYDPEATYSATDQFYYKLDDSTYKYAEGGRPKATDGHTFYGNVFGGGSGYMPFAPGRWRETAGNVYGNTKVEISGGHILTNVYGGNELTNVNGTSEVTMTGGTIGVPRTETQIKDHPVTCYLFGAGKGDQRIFFNKSTNVNATTVTVSGGQIYGSVFGGGEDGHIMRSAAVDISQAAGKTTIIGTWGTTYVDGNIFGGGRGFGGDALTAGNVGGDVSVTIRGGRMLGSVYGGGRLASVGYGLYFEDDADHRYGVVRPDNEDDEGNTVADFPRGHISVSISGTAVIGNDHETDYERDHPRGGNVFGGSMGRLVKLDGSYILPLWQLLGSAKQTKVSITGGTIKSNVYGGAELGTVTGTSTVTIDGGTIGVSGRKHGNVYAGGYGSPELTDAQKAQITSEATCATCDSVPVFAGRTYGDSRVDVLDGTVYGSVYGGGEMASVGTDGNTSVGNTLVNIGAAPEAPATAYSGEATIHGNVYGANNLSGTPFGNTVVNIYKTARSAKQEATYTDADREYELANVFGGGHEADYAPKDNAKRATVYVYGCENTIEDLFGGGDAAAAYGVVTIVDGGRFDRIFGGGNGEDNPADIGAGGTNLTVHAGKVRQIFGGSNEQGSINGPLVTLLDHTNTTCTQEVDEFYAGSNLADITGNLDATIRCGVGTVGQAYGGCNLAHVNGSTRLNIYGGTFETVYGGSRGDDATDATISDNATLNIMGGTIATAYGGSNKKGNIGGKITVNLLDQPSCTLNVNNIYGGGNLAPYTPASAGAYPEVNLINGTVSKNGTEGGNVYGGGYGSSATVTSSPSVRIGYTGATSDALGLPTGTVVGTSVVNVEGSVYGGGNEAAVTGATSVAMRQHVAEGFTASSYVSGSIYGGGNLAAVSGVTSVDIDSGTVAVDVYGGGAFANTGGATVSLDGGTVKGSLYGGALGDGSHSPTLSGPVAVSVSGGTVVGNVYGCNNAAGSPTSTVTVTIQEATPGTMNVVNVFGGGNAADATCSPKVDIMSGTVANVYGGGNVAGTAGSEVNLKGGTVSGGVYGGSYSTGTVSGNTAVNLTGGYVGTSGTRATGGVFGGGYGADTRVSGNVHVTLDGSTLYSDLYGGSALGNVNTSNSNTTIVDVLDGNIYGNVYGGGLGDADNAAKVYGVVTVNIGTGTMDASDKATSLSGSANIYTYDGNTKGGCVFGGNNLNGSPQDNVTVNIWKVNQTSATEVDGSGYAIDQVFGGGNLANFPDNGMTVTTLIHGCDNTVRRVFGGGNAAAVPNIMLRIDGGRFGYGWGGGNGENSPADVNGNITVYYSGKWEHELTVGSNSSGNISGSSSSTEDPSKCGAADIEDFYCGSTNTVIVGSKETTIACGSGTYKNIYGGSKYNDYYGNITMILNGSTATNVYGGCNEANVKAFTSDHYPAGHTDSIGKGGNINIILHGGTFENIYGGCRTTGNVEGQITITVDESDACPLTIKNIYGGGNLASYSPTVAGVGAASPEVIIKNGTVSKKSGSESTTGNVYGGGKGSTATVTASPVVTIGDATSAAGTATIEGNVYGGGDEAGVIGSTTVSVVKGSTAVAGDVYGGGNRADVTQSVEVVIGGSDAANAPTVSGDVYGGGALANVGGGSLASPAANTTHTTSVTLNHGNVRDIYGGGLGNQGNSQPASVYGPVQVTVNGGTAGNVYGCNNAYGAPQSTVQVDIYGTDQPASGYALQAVYGGGNLAHANGVTPQVTIHNCDNKIGTVYGGGNEAAVLGTAVTVYGGNTIGAVYGGGNKANVGTDGTTVDIHGGTITDVFGGNNMSGTIGGPIAVNVEKEAESGHTACEMHIDNVYGGGNHASSAAGTITVGCTGTDRTEGIHTVYGGANEADITGNINLTIGGGNVDNVFGGNNTSGTIGGTVTVNIDRTRDCFWYVGTVYGGGNQAAYSAPTATHDYPQVNIQNGEVSLDVFGGGLGSGAVVTGNPHVNVGHKTDAAKSATVGGSVYGGGSAANVVGNTQVNLQGKAEVVINVYGGGKNGDVDGQTNVTLSPQD